MNEIISLNDKCTSVTFRKLSACITRSVSDCLDTQIQPHLHHDPVCVIPRQIGLSDESKTLGIILAKFILTSYPIFLFVINSTHNPFWA